MQLWMKTVLIGCKVSSFCDTLALCMEKKGSFRKKADECLRTVSIIVVPFLVYRLMYSGSL